MILVGSWSLVGCPVYYSVLMTVLGYSEIDMGSVVIAITLKDVSEPAGNTLYIGSDSRSWEILNPETQQDIPVSPTFRARFFARYNNPPDPATEIVDTVELIGNGTQLDSAADVSYTFIDIVEVRIDNAPVVAP